MYSPVYKRSNHTGDFNHVIDYEHKKLFVVWSLAETLVSPKLHTDQKKPTCFLYKFVEGKTHDLQLVYS